MSVSYVYYNLNAHREFHPSPPDLLVTVIGNISITIIKMIKDLIWKDFVQWGCFWSDMFPKVCELL